MTLFMQHTTNYTNAFVAVADDSPALHGEVPPMRGDKITIAAMQYEMISKHPYKYTSDDVIFHCYAVKNELTKAELAEGRKQFFSKGQACMRASPLTKRYGWGVHNNAEGKIAIYAVDSPEYKKFLKDKKLMVVKGMRSKRV
jgi:hypothetical protein